VRGRFLADKGLFCNSDAQTKAYVSKGPVSAAVVKEAANRHFQLVAYYSPQSLLTSVDLNATFSFTLQADGYGTFMDATERTWSLKFASVDAATDFAQHVALGKSGSGGARNVVVQDLTVTKDFEVKTGDMCGITYTGWLVADFKLVKVFDSNVGKIKKVVLGNDRGVIAGWHQAIPGMTKGGVRFVVVPAGLAYGQEGQRGTVPPNSVVAYRLELVKARKGTAAPLAAGTPTDPEAVSRGQIIDRMKNIAVQAWPVATAPASADRHDDSAEEQSGTGADTLAVYQPKEAAMPPAVKEQMEAMRLQMEKMKQDAEVERRVREAEEKVREAERKAKEAEEKARAQAVVQPVQPQMMMQPARRSRTTGSRCTSRCTTTRWLRRPRTRWSCMWRKRSGASRWTTR
jgi:hypothetical protein